MEASLKIIVVFAIGVVVGNVWSFDFTIIGASSFVSIASKTSNLNKTYHGPIVGDAETHHDHVIGEAEAHHEPVVGESAIDTLEGIHKMSTTDSSIEKIASRADRFMDGPARLCAALVNRANGTKEGSEPWRSSGGLLWTHTDCGREAVHSLGNHLSRWYMVRAIASAAGVTIQLDCRSPITDSIPQHCEPSRTALENGSSFSWKDACQLDKEHLRFPHQGRNGLEHMVGAIRSDLRNMTHTILSKTAGLARDLDEVVVHLRTGDIGQNAHPCYGLVPFHVYTNLIPRTAQTIGVITAPFRQGGRFDFNEAVTLAARDYIRSKFPDARVSIRNGNESMAVTYARMVAANWSFCGSSTFCLYPALATAGKSYILQSPLYGGTSSWLGMVAEMLDNVHYIKDEMIFSTEYHGWNVSYIVERLQRNTGS
ncbi:hypothetical protein MHU86_8413 [Fragilaria crotonensis]|nr:hypothetical protein MHU86_8413 [Fragilaria crotonensis]